MQVGGRLYPPACFLWAKEIPLLLQWQADWTSAPCVSSTRWFKYDRDDLCVNKSQFVPVIFEPHLIQRKLRNNNITSSTKGPKVAQLAEALCHKTRGPGSDSRRDPLKFSSNLLLLSAFSSPGFHWASNINEYQGISFGVKCGRQLELTTLLCYLCRMSKQGWKHNIPPPASESTTKQKKKKKTKNLKKSFLRLS
jgi:hypothetical protein